ncbi:MAG: hypothetical protein R3E79_08465 [Caldilineaceae bacterium]
MAKIWAIAWKELYTTLRDRNLLLIMFATPLALSTIIGLAFGGLGSDSPTIAEIPVAVVNLDQGLDVGSLISDTTSLTTGPAVTSTGLPAGFAFNVGSMIASILLSEPITASGVISTADSAFDVVLYPVTWLLPMMTALLRFRVHWMTCWRPHGSPTRLSHGWV